MRKLWNALQVALVAEGTIKSATGHTDVDPRVSREFRPDKFKKRALYFTEVATQVPFGFDADQIWDTEIDLICVGETELTCADIQKAVTDLWRGAGNSSTYLDISNSDIICCRTKILDITVVRFNPATDVWTSVVSIELKNWSYA